MVLLLLLNHIENNLAQIENNLAFVFWLFDSVPLGGLLVAMQK